MRYHFILPAKDDSDPWKSTASPAAVLSDRRNNPSPFTPQSSLEVFEDRTHLLHGLIHINGFGHLMRMNRDTESPHQLTGKQLMGLWDRLCDLLRARLISTEDVSHKVSGIPHLRLARPGSRFILRWEWQCSGDNGAPGALPGDPRPHLVWPVGLPIWPKRLQCIKRVMGGISGLHPQGRPLPLLYVAPHSLLIFSCPPPLSGPAGAGYPGFYRA